MIYFIKNKEKEKSFITPSIILALVYTDLLKLKLDQNGQKFWLDEQRNKLSTEAFLTLYISSWKLCYLITLDLIEDKFGYEKDQLKVIDRLFLDLNADSFDLAEIALQLEKGVGIPIYEDLYFEQIIDLSDYIFWILIRKFKRFSLIYTTQERNN